MVLSVWSQQWQISSTKGVNTSSSATGFGTTAYLPCLVPQLWLEGPAYAKNFVYYILCLCSWCCCQCHIILPLETRLWTSPRLANSHLKFSHFQSFLIFPVNWCRFCILKCKWIKMLTNECLQCSANIDVHISMGTVINCRFVPFSHSPDCHFPYQWRHPIKCSGGSGLSYERL